MHVALYIEPSYHCLSARADSLHAHLTSYTTFVSHADFSSLSPLWLVDEDITSKLRRDLLSNGSRSTTSAVNHLVYTHVAVRYMLPVHRFDPLRWQIAWCHIYCCCIPREFMPSVAHSPKPRVTYFKSPLISVVSVYALRDRTQKK